MIVSYQTRELTLEAVDSVLSSEGVDARVFVVDNASSDGSADAVRARFPSAVVLEAGTNVGFGRANNLAFAEAEAPWVLLLNSDARFADPGGLAALVDALAGDPGAGVVGPRLESPQGVLEYSVRAFPSVSAELAGGTGAHRLLSGAWRSRRLGREFRDHAVAGDADWLTGACLLVRREVIEQVGGFDPAYFLYGEELEWCWRIREAGWRISFRPEVRVIHRRGASSGAGGGPSQRAMRLALAGEAYAVRRHRGVAYLTAFWGARLIGFAAEALLQGVVGLVGGDPARRSRAAWALRAGRAWLTTPLRGMAP